jgi:hypothetical protein
MPVRKNSRIRFVANASVSFVCRQMVMTPHGMRRGRHACWGMQIISSCLKGKSAIPSVIARKPQALSARSV